MEYFVLKDKSSKKLLIWTMYITFAYREGHDKIVVYSYKTEKELYDAYTKFMIFNALLESADKIPWRDICLWLNISIGEAKVYYHDMYISDGEEEGAKKVIDCSLFMEEVNGETYEIVPALGKEVAKKVNGKYVLDSMYRTPKFVRLLS